MLASKPPLMIRLVSCGSGSAEVVVDGVAVAVNSVEAVDSAEVVAVVDSVVVDPVLSVEAEDRVAEVVTDSLTEAVVDSVVVRTVVLSVEAVDRAEEVVDSVADAVLISAETVDAVSEEAVVLTLKDEEDKDGKHGEATTPQAKANTGSTNISDLMVKQPTHERNCFKRNRTSDNNDLQE